MFRGLWCDTFSWNVKPAMTKLLPTSEMSSQTKFLEIVRATETKQLSHTLSYPFLIKTSSRYSSECVITLNFQKEDTSLN